MKTNKTTGLHLLRSQRILLPLIVIAVLLFVVALSSAGKPAYAASATPGQIVTGPGPGMGGGGGSSSPTYNIYGQVFNCPNGDYVSNVTVCVWNTQGALCGEATTDSSGDFNIVSLAIMANSEYLVTVNSYLSGLGTSPIDPTWCQYSAYVETNSLASGMAQPIPLAPATIVNVTYAALYSNTKFATLSYGIGSSSDFYHTLSFGVLNSGINVGYTTATARVTQPQ